MDIARRTTLRWSLALGCALGSTLACGARAQTVNSGVSAAPSQELSQPTAAAEQAVTPAPSVEHLFGDWGGLRTYLGNLGIDLLVDTTTEFAGNVSGGVKQGATFANQVGFEVDVNWEKLAGVPGLSTHTVIVNRSGSSDSGLFGDNLEPVQEIYGAGGNTVVHLVYTYAEESLYNGRVDLALGRFPLANDFAASPLYCNFMSNSLCGNPKALPGGDVGFASYPDAAWGLRARVRPTANTYIQSGVFEVNQDLYNYDHFRSGFEFDTSKDSGVEVPVEVAYEPQFGTDKLIGHYKLGFGWDNSQYSSVYNDVNGAPAILTGNPAKTYRGKTQVWALADQMLMRNGPGLSDGLIVMGGFIHNDPNTSTYAEEYYASLLDRGFWAARPEDTIGLLFSYNTVSGRVGKTEALEQEFGIPFTPGVTGVQTHEEILEVNYDIHAFRGVNFEPDFQYVFRPNAQGNIHDAAVFGFKSHIEF